METVDIISIQYVKWVQGTEPIIFVMIMPTKISSVKPATHKTCELP